MAFVLDTKALNITSLDVGSQSPIFERAVLYYHSARCTYYTHITKQFKSNDVINEWRSKMSRLICSGLTLAVSA